LSFIVRFNWKTSNHLKEALQLLLNARLDDSGAWSAARPTRQPPLVEAGEYRQIRRIIAGNPNTPPSVLSYLSKDSDPDVHTPIAENPNSPLGTLERLARCKSAKVRAAVAENVNVSPDILTVLEADRDDDVRYSLAENPHLPEELLVALTEDSNPYV